MRLNHNSLALNASNHYAKINQNIAKSMERLSSGYRITSPADDAAGLAISTKMDAQIRGLDRAKLNSNDGISVIESAEGGLSEIESILGRMRELAVHAANDVEDEIDRDAIQVEINALRDEIDQIVETTAFNNQNLLDGNISRRSLSDDPNLKTTFMSESVSVGVYNISVTTAARKAVYGTGLAYSTATVTAEQADTIRINGFDVAISEGMSMTDVYETLQSHLSKIGVDVMASFDGGITESPFDSGASVYFISKEYGSSQKIEIEVGNPQLAALLGVNDGDKREGRDCKANLLVSNDGFSNTATLSTDGNEIKVTDRNGFEMDLEVEAGKTATNVSVEVLSAGTMIIQTGANSGEQVSLDIPSVSSHSLKVDNLIMYTHQYASEAITAIDEAVEKVSNIRSKLGAYQNRLDDIYDNLSVQSESMTEAYSRIMDTDMAEEMTNYTHQDVLSQAAISMMQKSNERPESILQLLQ